MVLLWAFCLVHAFFGHPSRAQELSGRYSYIYKGTQVWMEASPIYIVIQSGHTSDSAFAEAQDLVRDSLSDREPARKNRWSIFRQRDSKARSRDREGLLKRVRLHAAKGRRQWQPVFEDGSRLVIPSDEVVVGFKDNEDVRSVETYLRSEAAHAGILHVRPFRRNTFIVTISNPEGGRSFEVASYLSTLPAVRFSEPNHVFIQQDDVDDWRMETNGVPLADLQPRRRDAARDPLPPSSNSTWTVIESVDFESPTFPPSGWQTSVNSGYTQAYWGRTSYRSKDGSYAAYCALGGSAGVSPPGPVPPKMSAWLYSPLHNLTTFEEAYVELWFYAKNDQVYPGGTIYDYGALFIFDNSTGSYIGYKLGIAATGDCAADPTTESGWRRALFRVPPQLLTSQAYIALRYSTDSIDLFEGCYVDSITLKATADVDTEPLGNDTYAARLCSHLNTGQIAGLGNDSNDLHVAEVWDSVPEVTNITVAIIDEGVDTNHPDLNVVSGFDYNGVPGGWSRGNHGTACAGEAGARRGNGVGVIGTAPGVRLMSVYYGSTLANAALAFDIAVSQGARVLSCSWAAGLISTALEDAIDDAVASNCVVLFAAGNGPDRSPWNYDVKYPARLTASKDIICVGASSPTDEHKDAASSDGFFYWGSSYIGSGPDVVVPGTWSYTTDRLGGLGYNTGAGITTNDEGDYYARFGGTSSSTPKLAGIVALILAKNPTLTPAQIKSLLRDSADDIETPGVDDKTGGGRVNAVKALSMAPKPFVTLSGGLAFGAVTTGLTAQAWLVITNSGSAGLTVSQIMYPSGFSGAWTGVISKGSADYVLVTFAPAAATNYGGSITVVCDATNAGVVISCSGTGAVGPVTNRILGLAGDLRFGDVQTNTVAERLLVITNSGNADLAVTNIVCPVAFASPWTGIVAGGSATNISVQFSPVNPVGYGGVITVQSDATVGGDMIQCSGTGALQVVTNRNIGVSGSLAFGRVLTNIAVTNFMVLTNTGNAGVLVTNILYPDGFSGAWSGAVYMASSVTVKVYFQPPSTGAHGGLVIVQSDATNDGNTIACSGTGVAVFVSNRNITLTGNLNFGNVQTNTVSTNMLGIGNSGNSPLSVSNIVYPAGFSGGWTGVVAAGQSTNVRVFFSPEVPVAYSGTVVVLSDATTGVGTMPCSGTGSLQVVTNRNIDVSGDMEFGSVVTNTAATNLLFLSNAGTHSITVTNISCPTGFSGSWTGVLAVGGSTSVAVRFAPVDVTNYAGEVVVFSDATNEENSARCSGFGVSRAVLGTIRPDALHASNLVAYWKLDEDSGGWDPVARADISGFTNNLNDPVDQVTPYTGSVADNPFLGSDEHSAVFEQDKGNSLEVSDAMQSGLSFTGGARATFAFWIKPNSVAENNDLILGKYDYNAGGPNVDAGYGVRFSSTNSRMRLNVNHNGAGGATRNITATNRILVGSWTHIAITADFASNIVAIYINGVCSVEDLAFDVDPRSTAGRPFRLGRNPDVDSVASGTQNFLDALLKDVAIWNTILTSNEIWQLSGMSDDVPTGYAAWVQQITNGLTNYSDSAAGDGYPNLLKYAAGSSPTNSDGLAAVSSQVGTGTIRFVFNRNTNAEDVTILVEGALGITNGTLWEGIATNVYGSWGGASNVSEVGSSNPVRVTVEDYAAPSSNRFMRLRVTLP